MTTTRQRPMPPGNYAFIAHFQGVARGHFTVRRLFMAKRWLMLNTSACLRPTDDQKRMSITLPIIDRRRMSAFGGKADMWRNCLVRK